MRHEIIAIPEIKTNIFNSIKIYFDEDFSEVLFPNNGPILELQEYIQTIFSKKIGSFREQVVFRSIPFLIAVFTEDKEIRISGTKLGQELFLCHHYDHADDPKFIAFKNHVTKIAMLSPHESISVTQKLTITKNLSDLNNLDEFQKVYDRSNEIMKKLRNRIKEYSPSLFEKFSDYGLSLTANYAILRIHLLKFLAILPSLDYDHKGNEVKRVLLEALRRILDDNNRAKKAKATGDQAPLSTSITFLFQLANLVAYFLPANTLAFIVRAMVKTMAKRFIAGETIEKAKDGLKELYRTNRDATLDQLGELVVSEKEADNYRDEVIKLIKGFSLHVKKGDKNKAGINRAHVSIKVSALCSDFKPHSFDYSFNLVAPRLKEILLIAKEHDVFINIDAEHYHYRDVVLKIYSKVLLDNEELEDFKSTGIVVQAYLRDGLEHLKDVIELAKKRKINMPIRLVKGAYWDAETIEAEAHGNNAPQFLNKEETDIYFRQLIVEILKNGEHLQLCIASHNFGDHSFSEALREQKYPLAPIIEHQCLHMTYEALSIAMAKMGWPTRNYVPVGSLLVGMAYLVRRIMENSSQVGVLTIMRSHNDDKVFKRPEEVHLEQQKKSALVFDSTVSQLSEDFPNVAPLRTYLDDELIPLKEAHEKFKKEELGKVYENDITKDKPLIDIHSSSDPSIIVGKIAFGDREDAIHVVERSLKYYNEGEWTHSSWIERASIMFKVAKKLLMRRNELSALIVYEAGKTF
ncbi:MAG: bifunctional proline dehydrogenase/L-glutamate gamma-semialdehyde dehydrogenase, partial [Bdellovibrionales bacterium]|nr:bifunctional proline dehydrogenase/L-glutamate gamma-semialdehyde dehydrogenase [Bdellovibrionales bacterium]